MRTIIQNILLLIALLMVPGVGVHAEESNNIRQIEKRFDYENVQKQTPSTQEQSNASTVQLSLIENNHQYVLITASLYAFSLIIITVLMKITPDHQANDLITIIGLVSVVFGTILLVLVVDTTEGLTAPMGILGAIAGYLFGAAQKKEVSQK